MSDLQPPLNAKELMQRLGLKKSRFHVLRGLGRYKRLEVKGLSGQRKYSREKVERLLAGESLSDFGERA